MVASLFRLVRDTHMCTSASTHDRVDKKKSAVGPSTTVCISPAPFKDRPEKNSLVPVERAPMVDASKNNGLPSKVQERLDPKLRFSHSSPLAPSPMVFLPGFRGNRSRVFANQSDRIRLVDERFCFLFLFLFSSFRSVRLTSIAMR